MPSSLCRRIRVLVPFAAALSFAVGSSPVAEAQPFGHWNIFHSGELGYITVPHHPALNPSTEITIEGWVNLDDSAGCRSIIGKNWEQAWWVGMCEGELRSHLHGGSMPRTAGNIADKGWTHFAVTFDGNHRYHYVNGELYDYWFEPGPLPSSGSPVRIGRDVAWEQTPDGAINELRLWSVARTQAELRSTINVPLTSPQPGLVAVWAGDGPNDVVGGHDGTIVGNVTALTFPVALGCTTTETQLCLHDRFVVTVDWRVDGAAFDSGTGKVAPLTTDKSGIFWFFEPENWELMVKVLDACGVLNDRFWVFSAATTNVHYRMEVFDVEAGANKVYFNYPGPPAPAVTDTDAFATCP